MATQNITIFKAVSKLHKLIMTDKKDITSTYLYATLAALLQLSLPLGIQAIISYVMAGSISTSIYVLIGMVVTGTFLNGLLQVKQMEVIEKLKQKIFVRYSFEFNYKLPKLNIQKLDAYYLPELVNRFFETVSLQKSFDKILLDIPAAVIQIFLGILLLFIYHPYFIGFGILLIILLAVVLRFTSPLGLDTAFQASNYKYKIASWLEEIARTVKSFKYAKNKKLQENKIDHLVTGYLDSKTSHFKLLMIQYWAMIAFKTLITISMLVLGVSLLVNQQINIGQFIAVDIVIIAIMASIEKLITNIDSIYDSLVSIEKLAKITEAEVEESGTIALEDTNTGVDIEFKDVTFGYTAEQIAIENTSLTINANECIQIKGKSGSGKSTILRLLTGAYTTFNGNILIENIPLRNYDVDTLHKNTGVLLSAQDIIEGTISENISLGGANVPINEIADFTKLIGLTDFINNNPKGFDTMLQPNGSKLPNTVRQKILLTRAILGNNRLLLLEEPFQWLTEETIKDVMAYLKASNTTIIIASDDERITKYVDRSITMKSIQPIY
jgi:ATP-binding cassette, subfamily B, bacterial